MINVANKKIFEDFLAQLIPSQDGGVRSGVLKKDEEVKQLT